MAKQLVFDYEFDASARTITLDGIYAQKRLLLITNMEDNQIIYAFNDSATGLSDISFDYENDTTTLTLEYDTTSMSDTDPLQVFIEGSSANVRLDDTYVDPVSKIRVSQPENLIDTDFEYGLQSTKWETLELVKNIPTFFSRNGEASLPVTGMSVTLGSEIVTVTTSEDHELTIGTPVIVQGSDEVIADGAFVVTKVTDATTFQYKAKDTFEATKTILDTYTQIFIGSVYQGTEFALSNLGGIVTDAGTPSTLTVTTEFPTDFAVGTSFFLSNSVGGKELSFASGDIEPDNFDTGLLEGTANTATGETDNWNVGRFDVNNFLPLDAKFFSCAGSEQNASVDPGTDIITFTTPHGFDEGQLVCYFRGFGNVAIGGLTDTQPYFVKRVDTAGYDGDYSLQLSTSFGGSPVNITNTGASNGMVRQALVKAYRPSSIDINTETMTFTVPIPGLENGGDQRVLACQTTIGGLSVFSNSDNWDDIEDNTASVVFPLSVTNNGRSVVWSTSRNGSIAGLNTTTANGALIRIVPNPTRDSMYFANHGFRDGDMFRFESTSTVPSGIGNNALYTAVVKNVNRFGFNYYDNNTPQQVLNSYGNAAATVRARYWDRYNDSGDFIPLTAHGLSNGEIVTYSDEGGTTVGGLTDGQPYYVFNASENQFQLASSALGYDDDGLSTLLLDFTQRETTASPGQREYTWYITGHGLSTGDRIIYTSNSPIPGVRNGGLYYVRRIDANVFSLYKTAAHATAGSTAWGETGPIFLGQPKVGAGTIRRVTAIDLTSAGTGAQKFSASTVGASDGVYSITAKTDTQTYEMDAAFDIPSRTIGFTSASSVWIEEDSIRVPDHAFVTGAPVLFATSGTEPGGLTDATTYYVIRVSRNWVKLATTSDNAADGIAIDLTSRGVGSHSLTTSSIAGEVAGGGVINLDLGSRFVRGEGTNFSSFFNTGDNITLYQPEVYSAEKTVTGVNTANDTFTATAHGFTTEDIVRLNAATAPTNFIAGALYYVGVVDVNTLRLFSTAADASANTNPIDVTDAGTSVTLQQLTSTGSTTISGISYVNGQSVLEVAEAATESFVEASYAVSTALLVRADGFALHRPFDGGVELIPSTNPDSRMIRQTRRYFRYQSGKGIQVSYAVNFSPTTQMDSLVVTDGSSATRTGTITTKFPHRLSAGLQLVMSGATGAFTTLNGVTLTVTGVTNERTFTISWTAGSTVSNASVDGIIEYYVVSWQNSALRCGLFDDQNGLFFEYDGSTLYVVRRSTTKELAGTVNVTFKSGIVTGNNTRFQSQVAAGDMISIRGQSYQVVSVQSDTQLSILPSYRGVTASRCIITKTVETKVPQTEWNIDKCDGTGVTGFNLDIHKIQMAYMDYSWYGAGKVRFGFKDQRGNVRYVHEFIHGNKETEAYLRSGNLPARYEIENKGTPTFVPALAHWGTSVIMDGRFDDDRAYVFTASSNNIQLTGTPTITANGRIETRNRYAIFVFGAWRDVDYGILLSAASSTFNSISGNQAITGANLQANTLTKTPSTFFQLTQQPYQPALRSRTDRNSSATEAVRDLIFVDRQPLATGTNNNYTITLSAIEVPVVVDLPLISIRLAPCVDANTPGFLGEREILNRMQLILNSVGILSTHSCNIKLVLNGQIDNNDWQRVQNPSLSQLIYHTNQDSIVGGVEVFNFRAQGGTGTTNRTSIVTTQELGEVVTLGNSILGGDGIFPDGPDVLTVVARLTEDPSTVSVSNPFTVVGRVSWSESQA